jgi:predicted pyridoxine 5'-phosphate oxidase superfamily flavin-nucleotide-binding protein
MAINDQQWSNILKYFGNCTNATASPSLPYCAFSTVNEDGSPRVAPYTSLILGDNGQGFYFDELSQNTSSNLERDQRICVLIVKNNKWFWIKTVIFGRFAVVPKNRTMC